MNTELLVRVQQADPAPPDANIPDGVWDAPELLDRLRDRTNSPVPQRTSTHRPWFAAMAARTQGRVRGWQVAAIAAVATVIVLGGVAWLSQSGGGAPVVDETPPTTIADVTPTTEAAITTDTVAETTITLTAIPIVPPGEGPKLVFVQADVVPDVDLSKGVWFNGALYALGQGHDSSGRTLHRSTDGFRWEVVSGLPASDGDAWDSLLQTDGEQLVNVVMTERNTIEVFTSLDGDDWISTIIEPPIPAGSNVAGEFRFSDGSGWPSGVLSVGPKGIMLAATVTLSFEGENFANGLVDPDEGIHVEVVDLDMDRGVMIVKFLDENNDMTQIGELEEIDLNGAGFSGAFSSLLDAMAADPDWNRGIEGFMAQLTDEFGTGFASASVGYAWHSTDGINWQRIDTAGPLDGGAFSALLATPDGWVATASSRYEPSQLSPTLQHLATSFDGAIVWESTDGTTWIQASGLTSQHGFDRSLLAEWQGDIIELSGFAKRRENKTNVWALADPSGAVFADIPTNGMVLEVTELGLIGTPTYGWEGPDKMEILFSPDRASWNRWEPSEFGQGSSETEAWVVGVGSNFVIVQSREWEEGSEELTRSVWVGRLP